MKKLLLIVLCLSILSPAYGASDDVYVRQDVFDAKMDILNSKLDRILEELKLQKEEIQTQKKEIIELGKSVAVLAERIDGNYKNLDARMGDLRNGLYLGLVLFAAVIILPFFNKWWEGREEKKRVSQPSFTLEDVKRLIEENNVRFNLRPQV